VGGGDQAIGEAAYEIGARQMEVSLLVKGMENFYEPPPFSSASGGKHNKMIKV
jgi:hypothetical protein